MTNIYEYKDYREYLKSILEEKRNKNHYISLRAFARFLKLSPTHLTQILNKKRHLSLEKAIAIGLQLKLTDEEIVYFTGLVTSETEHTPSIKNFIHQYIEKIKISSTLEPIKPHPLKTAFQWYHFAILEMTEMAQFKSDPLWIAKHLGLSLSITKKAIQELEKARLLIISKNNHWKKTEENFFSVSPTPNLVFQKFHKKTLFKAAQSLKLQDLTKRHFSSTIFSIDTEKLPEAYKKIRKFRLDMQKLLNSGNKTRVYQLAIQLFDLMKGAALLLLLGINLCFAGGSHIEGGGDYLRIKIKEAKFLAAQALQETPEIIFKTQVQNETLITLFKNYHKKLSEDLIQSPLLFYDEDSLLFMIDGKEQTAMTASEPFYPIRINLKRCKELNISPIGIAILLIRESARHLGIFDDHMLDEIENMGQWAIEYYLKSLGTKNEYEQEVLCFEALILENIRISQEISFNAKSALTEIIPLKNYLDSIEETAFRLPTYEHLPFICRDIDLTTQENFIPMVTKIDALLRENSQRKRKMVLWTMKLKKENQVNQYTSVSPETVQFILSLFPQ